MRRKQVVYIVALVFILVLFVALFSNNHSDNEAKTSTNTEDTLTYKVTSHDSNRLTGWVRTSATEFDDTKLEWVVVITDPSIINNGKCIDESGSTCADSKTVRDAANTRYHYGLTLASTEDDEVVAATTITPIYCNKQAVLANLSQFVDKEYSQRTDYRCDGAALAMWKPTDSFISINTTTINKAEDILGEQTLNIYDIHATYTYREQEGGFNEGNRISNQEFKDQPLIETYPVTVAVD